MKINKFNENNNTKKYYYLYIEEEPNNYIISIFTDEEKLKLYAINYINDRFVDGGFNEDDAEYLDQYNTVSDEKYGKIFINYNDAVIWFIDIYDAKISYKEVSIIDDVADEYNIEKLRDIKNYNL